jgi:hypothetical protein
MLADNPIDPILSAPDLNVSRDFYSQRLEK